MPLHRWPSINHDHVQSFHPAQPNYYLLAVFQKQPHLPPPPVVVQEPHSLTRHINKVHQQSRCYKPTCPDLLHVCCCAELVYSVPNPLLPVESAALPAVNLLSCRTIWLIHHPNPFPRSTDILIKGRPNRVSAQENFTNGLQIMNCHILKIDISTLHLAS